MGECWDAATEAAKPRWIPVTERLPIKHGYYPCVYIGLFHKTWDRTFFDGTTFERKYKDEPDILYWFDIPELPE